MLLLTLITLDESDLECFFFLDLCRFLSLSVEEERREEELEVEECFLFL